MTWCRKNSHSSCLCLQTFIFEWKNRFKISNIFDIFVRQVAVNDRSSRSNSVVVYEYKISQFSRICLMIRGRRRRVLSTRNRLVCLSAIRCNSLITLREGWNCCRFEPASSCLQTFIFDWKLPPPCTSTGTSVVKALKTMIYCSDCSDNLKIVTFHLMKTVNQYLRYFTIKLYCTRNFLTM